MAIEYGYSGLHNGGTFKVAAATKSTISADPKQIIGKVVTITGNYEVGYGSATAEPFGVVTQIENECANSEDFVVSVLWGQTFEDVPCAGTENAGEFLACDGNGGVATSVDATCCKALGVDTSNNVCTIKIV